MRVLAYKVIPDLTQNSISFSKNYRIFSSTEPLPGAISIIAFSESLNIGSADPDYIIRKFRYSFDMGNWSLWYGFSNSDISNLTSLDFLGKSVFFELKYEYDDTTYNKLDEPLSINFVKFNVKSSSVSESLFSPTVYCSSEKCPAIISDKATFNPYDVSSAIGIAKEMSFQTNLMFGHEVVYFKTEPDRTNGDFIFKEWTIMETVSRKCIKVMVPDNKFPDNKPNFGEFGVDFEVPFEIHIDHAYFQSMFGHNSQPRKRDYMYFPLTNRMYEIQGSYLYRGFMMEPIYWKIQLTKFQPNADMSMSQSDRKFLDNMIMTSEQLFGKQAEIQTKDQLQSQQFKTISQAFDETRLSLHPDIINKIQDYTFNYSPLIEYYYDMSGISPNIETYELVHNGDTGDQFISPNSPYSVWAYENSGIYQAWKNKSLNTGDSCIGPNPGQTLTLRMNGPKDSHTTMGHYLEVDAYRTLSTKPNDIRDIIQNPTGFVTFKQSEYGIIYKSIASTNITPNMTFCSLFNLNKGVTNLRMFEGYDNLTNQGLTISCSIQDSYGIPSLTFYIQINQNQYSFQIGQLSYSTWYSLIVPTSSIYGQLELNLYGFNQDPSNIKNFNGIAQLFTQSINIGTYSFDTCQNWAIPSGNYSVSNIRLFNTMIQDEDHEFVISQLFVRDESMLELIDNARPRLNLPFIAINR